MTPSRAPGTIPVRLDVGFPENKKIQISSWTSFFFYSSFLKNKNENHTNTYQMISYASLILIILNYYQTHCEHIVPLQNMLEINGKCWLNSSQSVSFVSISMTLMLVSFLLLFLFYVSSNLIIILYQSIIVYFYLLDILVTWKNL